MKTKLLNISLLVCLITIFTGCGSKGPKRLDVWGSVTWKGKPVPNGIITIEPDASKKNVGPQGSVIIKDGKFDTRSSINAKGCFPGPSIVSIQGSDGKDISDYKPYGSRIFALYSTKMDIPENGGELNLVVPDSVAPLPASNQREME